MPKKKIKYKEIIQLANEARIHAKRSIRAGDTWLNANDLPSEYFQALKKGMEDIRGVFADLTHEQPEEEKKKNTLEYRLEIDNDADFHKEVIARTFRMHNLLEKSPYVNYYENVIAISSKYDLGNCGELAYFALDYILYHAPPELNAETYSIRGGNHSFLVINRDPNSDPNLPETWGTDAVICDPWANKVYRARDYRTELKNFYTQENKNFIQDLQPHHVCAPTEPALSIAYFHRVRTVPLLKENFSNLNKCLLDALRNYENTLIATDLAENDPKLLTIAYKKALIKDQIARLDNVFSSAMSKEYKEYRLANAELTTVIVAMKNEVMVTLQKCAGTIENLKENFSKEIQSLITELEGFKELIGPEKEKAALFKLVEEQIIHINKIHATVMTEEYKEYSSAKSELYEIINALDKKNNWLYNFKEEATYAEEVKQAPSHSRVEHNNLVSETGLFSKSNPESIVVENDPDQTNSHKADPPPKKNQSYGDP